MSPDPIKNGANPYSYVNNNPLALVDPTGMTVDDYDYSHPPVTKDHQYWRGETNYNDYLFGRWGGSNSSFARYMLSEALGAAGMAYLAKLDAAYAEWKKVFRILVLGGLRLVNPYPDGRVRQSRTGSGSFGAPRERNGMRYPHQGLDMVGSHSGVRAVHDGVAQTYASGTLGIQFSFGGMNLEAMMIHIEHSQENGDEITGGEYIGFEEESNSWDPHTHIQLRDSDTGFFIDPTHFLDPSQPFSGVWKGEVWYSMIKVGDQYFFGGISY